MRIFVGTLYTIENEFEECVASIERQSYRNFQHFVFRNLPNKKAHDTLYRSFMEKAGEFDLMIKVDADMVIEDEHLFAKIVERFRSNGQLKDLEIAVHDFFSDRLIWGMHTYRNTVEWRQTDEDLFVDACPLDENERIHDDSELAPAAIHCKNPSPFQAFHYGVHKALKTIQPGCKEIDYGYTLYHWYNIESTRQNFFRTRDRRIGFAILGAELAFRGSIWPHHLDYTNPFLEKLYKPYEGLDILQLEQEIRKVTFFNLGFLPGTLRRRVLLRVARFKSRFGFRPHSR
jgi:hypothetical protein